MPVAKRSGKRRDLNNNRSIVPGKKPKIRRGRIGRDDDNHPHLPHDVVLVNILHRLPVKTLMRCGCVCKLWYNSIHRDPNFASSHLAQSLKNPPLMFCYLNVKQHVPLVTIPRVNHLLLVDEHNNHNPRRNNRKNHHILKKHKDAAGNIFFRLLLSLDIKPKLERVGSCNGLVCLSQSMTKGTIVIMNPSRSESLFVIRRSFDHEYIICYGFGFDSITNEYKVVLILGTVFPAKEEYKCVIFTLGTNSWRETSTSPPIGDLPLAAGGIRTRTVENIYKSAIFCGGSLFWRTKSIVPEAKEHMLLSFDLHYEQFEGIPLPAECYMNNSTEQQQVVDPLIEFRGFPCVPHLEIMGGSSDHLHQHYACKVHLHILKGKVQKVWIKETFDVHISPSSLRSGSCFFYDNSTPTRIWSSSGRVLLYWFNGKYLLFYDLHTKHFKVVKCAPLDKYRVIFESKIHSSHPEDDDDGNLCHTDYQLNYHVENLFSFQTFIPSGAPKLDRVTIMHDLRTDNRTPKVFLCLHKSSEYYYIVN